MTNNDLIKHYSIDPTTHGRANNLSWWGWEDRDPENPEENEETPDFPDEVRDELEKWAWLYTYGDAEGKQHTCQGWTIDPWEDE